MKLTIEQLKNYLGTGLKCETRTMDSSYQLYKEGFELVSVITYPDERVLLKRRKDTIHRKLDKIKPICYRLSDLDKFIPELGFVPMTELFHLWRKLVNPKFELEASTDNQLNFTFKYTLSTVNSWPFFMVQKLFQWHFWPFGDEYFEQGLVIDKLKLQDHA